MANTMIRTREEAERQALIEYQETRPFCDCGADATVTYFGIRFCQDCVDYMEEQRAEIGLCKTCKGKGRISAPYASDIMLDCPHCRPDGP